MAEKTTIARPYAQAVFALAQEQKDLKGWSAMLEVAATVAAHPDMVNVLESPRLPKAERVETFLAVCGDALNETGKNLVRVLAENNRLELLPEIAALYEFERAQAEQTLEAEVVSAIELTESQKQAIAAALKKRLSREISLSCTTDASLIGGAIIRAGDLVIDGSAAGRLDKLRAELMH